MPACPVQIRAHHHIAVNIDSNNENKSIKNGCKAEVPAQVDAHAKGVLPDFNQTTVQSIIRDRKLVNREKN